MPVRRREITYLGENLKQDGLKTDSEKIQAINNDTKLTNKEDAHCLLGMTKLCRNIHSKTIRSHYPSYRAYQERGGSSLEWKPL